MKTPHTRTLDKDGLSLREALFCRCVAINRSSSSDAAREAGYAGDLHHRAAELLKRPRIQKVVNRLRERLIKKAELKAEHVLEELRHIAFFRVHQIFNPDNTLKAFYELDEASSAAISSVSMRKGTVHIKFVNKLAALDLLGRYLKLWDGAGNVTGDRLKEVIDALREGPVGTETIH